MSRIDKLDTIEQKISEIKIQQQKLPKMKHREIKTEKVTQEIIQTLLPCILLESQKESTENEAGKKIVEGIIAENFTNLQIQEARQILSRTNTKKTTPVISFVNFQKTKDEEKNSLKIYIIYKKIQMTSDFSSKVFVFPNTA